MIKNNKFKGMLIIMALLVVVMSFVVVSGVAQKNVTGMIVNTTAQNNLVEFELDEFDNSLTSEDFTFSVTESYMRYVTVPKNSNVTNGSIILSGISGWCYQETANVSTSCGGLSTGKYYVSTYGSSQDVSNVIDGDWDTFGYSIIYQDNIEYFINYTKPINALNSSLWQVKHGDIDINLTINKSCWDYNNSILLFKFVSFNYSGSFSRASCYNGADFIEMSFELDVGDPFNPIKNRLYEEAMWWNISSGNVTLDIGNDGDVEFNNTGIFNTTNQTINFASEINEYLIGAKCYQETANVSTACGGLDTGNYRVDGGHFYINYTKPNGASNLSQLALKLSYDNEVNISINDSCWQQDILQFNITAIVVDNCPGYDNELSISCFDGSNFIGMYAEVNEGCHGNTLYDVNRSYDGYWSTGIVYNCVDDSWDYRECVYDGNVDNNLFEEAMWWNIGCEPDSNGNCNIPINITATNGKVQIDAINISYQYNVTSLFERDETYTWNQSENVVANKKYLRRYSISPTSSVTSQNISSAGYYMNDTATQCSINNTLYNVVTNYCPLVFNTTKGDYWTQHYIWDNTISNETAVNSSDGTWEDFFEADDSEDEASCDGDLSTSTPCGNAFDEDWGTSVTPNPVIYSVANVYENWTKKSDIAKLSVKYYRGMFSGEIDFYCYNNTKGDWSSLLNITSLTEVTTTLELPPQCLDGDKFQLRTRLLYIGEPLYYKEGLVQWIKNDTIMKEDTLSYFNPDLSTADEGLFTNSTLEYYYNTSISQNQKVEYYNSSSDTWHDITPTPQADCVTTPTYTKELVNGKVFWVCLSTSQKYVSIKVEENS